MLQELRNNSITSLQKLLVEKKHALEELRQNVLKQKEKNVKKLSALKKEVARIQTLLSEKKEN